MKPDYPETKVRLNDALVKLLFAERSPYDGFPLSDFEEKVEGWHCDNRIFEDLLSELRPNRILEVGTWLGGSALRMADLCAAKGLEAPILCVDTWLGGSEFWEQARDSSRYQQLNLHCGYPSVYYQFLANVIHRGHADRIVPFPQTSLIASPPGRQ